MYKLRLSHLLAAVLGLLVFIQVLPCLAEWKNVTTPVPAERIRENVRAILKKNPKSAHAYYVFARVDSMVFFRSAETLALNMPRDDKPGGLPGFAPWDSVQERTSKTWKLDPKKVPLLLSAIRNYDMAASLAPKQALYWLGKAWNLEKAIELGVDLNKTVSMPGGEPPRRAYFEPLIAKLGSDEFSVREKAYLALEVEVAAALPFLFKALWSKDAEIKLSAKRLIHHYWMKKALKTYREAYRLARAADLRLACNGPSQDDLVSLEAGKAILRILRQFRKTPERTREIEEVGKTVSTLKAKPRIVTPIILPLGARTALKDLLAPDRIVRFDLDGDGEASRWPWVGPDTGLLVWDPAASGRITSGLELFGSVTWWIRWPSGYHALAALDDDGDGWLTGEELKGLAVWRDGNSDGISDKGEVRPVADLAIEAISVQSLHTELGWPANRRGIRLTDGSTLPTYDWTPTSLAKRK